MARLRPSRRTRTRMSLEQTSSEAMLRTSTVSPFRNGEGERVDEPVLSPINNTHGILRQSALRVRDGRNVVNGPTRLCITPYCLLACSQINMDVRTFAVWASKPSSYQPMPL